MADLLVIVGLPAAGKAAIGHAVARLTGYRLFHNHLTAEPAAALFGWGTPRQEQFATELRLLAFSRLLENPTSLGTIFTFVWGFDLSVDNDFIAEVVRLFESKQQKVFFVELLPSLESRIAREGTPLRLSLKPSKNDVERARALHLELVGKYRLNSEGKFPYPDRHLIVDTDIHTPDEGRQDHRGEIRAYEKCRLTYRMESANTAASPDVRLDLKMGRDRESMLFELEQRLARVGRKLSFEEISALIAADFIEFGASGRVWTKEEIVAALSQWEPQERVVEDFVVRELSASVCLVTYRVLAVDRKPLPFSLRSSIWRHAGDQWQLIFHQGTNVK